ncbi:MAG: glycosyltransferase family 2 protein, partial [Acidimicrobiia bacterium]
MTPVATAPAWAAVVVHYRSGPLVADCVASLLADTGTDGVAPEVVVVDNGSDGDTLAALLAPFPSVTVLRPGANLGYARAANLGIAATRAPIVAVVNPDARLVPGCAVAVLAAFANDPTVAVVGPRICNPDGSVYPSARTAPGTGVAVGHALLGGVAPHNRFTTAYRQLEADPDAGRDVDWVSGAALWFRRDALDGAGGWDERFFMFMEDIDVCREIRAHGGRVRYEPRAGVVHAVGTSRAAQPSRSIALHHRAAYRYLDKWWRGPQRLALPAAGAFLGARAGWSIGAARLR